MEFQFNDRERAFQSEIEAFVREWLPSDWPDRIRRWPGGYGALEVEGDQEKEIAQQFRKKLAEKGWPTISWPKEYGGREYTYMEQAIFDERMSYHLAPAFSIATGIAGPTILRFGTDENKKDWVSKIANMEIDMWLGYSEPDAGSDLASIRTTAIRDGDDYIINGQKTWSSLAHVSDYAWMIARTDPEGHRHKSVSLFVVDNNTPGITIRPLINIVGLHSFNEVFFDNVRVPARNLIGQENMGFYYLMTALDFERLMVSIGTFKRELEQLVAYVRQAERDGAPLGRCRDVRKRLADIAVRIDVAYLFFWRTASMLDKGLVPSVESSALKLVTTELSRKMADAGMEILGPYGLLTGDSKWTPMQGMAPRGYLDCISATIGAGTSEIQRNIIAMRGLGLPAK